LQCQYCGKEESLPFVCNYCGGTFCGDHRLPEAHQCKGDITQKRTATAPPQTTFSWQTGGLPEQVPQQAQATIFSRIEIRDIIIAWFALGVAFSLSFVSRVDIAGGGGFGPNDFALFLVISLLTVGPGFVFHELSHKFVAQRYGFWAEFRMWPMGLVLALVTSLLGFIFAAPGATYISGVNISKAENGKISVAGPMMNILIAALFLPLYLYGTGFLGALGYYGTEINIFLALFNMLPIGPLDGSKVFHWNLLVWGVIFGALAVAFYFVFV